MGHFSGAWILHVIMKAVIYSAVFHMMRNVPIGVDVAIIVALVVFGLATSRRRGSPF